VKIRVNSWLTEFFRLKATIASGIEQTASYAATCGADEAHLLIFERDGKKRWNDRIWEREETVDGRVVSLWGM